MAGKLSPDLKEVGDLGKAVASLEGMGLTSRQAVKVNLYKRQPGEGLAFILVPNGMEAEAESGNSERLVVKAHVDSVISTTRNTALGEGKIRVCFVEHILCALALCNVDDLYIEVLGPELPMGNGSCDLWFDLLAESGLSQPLPEPDLKLDAPIILRHKDRILMALPSDKFSVTYLLEMDHPKIGRIWRTWKHGDDLEAVTTARTFGSLMEHQLLGFDKDVVSFTKDDFTMPLQTPDEPVRHKLLDMIGDLMLCGVNPLRIKADFISIKGGHAIDVEMAGKLSAIFERNR